jgi:hypothetical protein
VNKENNSIIEISGNANRANESASSIALKVVDNVSELNVISHGILEVENATKKYTNQVNDIQIQISNMNQMALGLETIVKQFS